MLQEAREAFAELLGSLPRKEKSSYSPDPAIDDSKLQNADSTHETLQDDARLIIRCFAAQSAFEDAYNFAEKVKMDVPFILNEVALSLLHAGKVQDALRVVAQYGGREVAQSVFGPAADLEYAAGRYKEAESLAESAEPAVQWLAKGRAMAHQHQWRAARIYADSDIQEALDQEKDSYPPPPDQPRDRNHVGSVRRAIYEAIAAEFAGRRPAPSYITPPVTAWDHGTK